MYIIYRKQTTKGVIMDYKKEIVDAWSINGGLINKAVAAKILGVNRSVFSHRKDIRKIKVGNDEFVSFSDILKNEDIKPRAKRKKT